jgi:hypothetical protein
MTFVGHRSRNARLRATAVGIATITAKVDGARYMLFGPCTCYGDIVGGELHFSSTSSTTKAGAVAPQVVPSSQQRQSIVLDYNALRLKNKTR